MKIVIRKISDLIFADYNPRHLTKEQHRQLKDSLLRFGFVDPVIVNKHPDRKDIIVGGHQRVKVWSDMGNTEVPTVEVNLSLDKEKELNIRLNRNTGEWDFEALENNFEITDLIEWGFDEKELGFDNEINEDDYQIPDEIKTSIQAGDLFELTVNGLTHRLMCGDAICQKDVEKLLDGNCPILCVADPPYGINIVGDNGKIGADKLAKNKIYQKVIGDETTDTAKNFYNTCISIGLKRFIIWGGNYFLSFLPFSPSWIIWDKRGDMNSNNFADGEMAWTNIKTPVRIYKQVWSGMIREGEKEQRIHPNQKPVKMLGNIISDFTKEGDIIYDGFLGSGTTMVAAHQLNRRCFGMEISPQYVQVCIDRMKKSFSEIKIKRNGKKWN